jgi:indolepyruvate ferredoxin oxidoreductase
MAYKDEYEVARLHAQTGFTERLRQQFDGRVKVSFYFAPPLLARRDPITGVPRKRRFGPWVYPVLRLLAYGRALRGTVFDVFGYSEERRNERQLIDEFKKSIGEQVLPLLSTKCYAEAVSLAELPQSIKGFGHIKERNRRQAMDAYPVLVAKFNAAVGRNEEVTPLESA